MKKTKIIAAILSVSMLTSISGCSLFDSDNKNVLTAANEYAEAVIEGDVKDLADLHADDDEFEEVVGAYIDRYSSSESSEEIHDIIHDNMTYEIDKKTLKSSKKSGKASVNIIFTLIDYSVIYEDLDDDADTDDFIDALEDNTDETMTIRATVEFKLSHDEWKVVDEDFETILDIYEFYSEISEYGFGRLRPITLDEFENAISNRNSSNYMSYDAGDEYEAMYFGDDYNVMIYYMAYDDADDASDFFEDTYDELEDSIADDEFDGTYDLEFDGNYGYMIFDGEMDGSYLYGGIYLTDNVIIYAIATSNSASDKEEVDEFLTAIGYPLP